MHVKKKLVAIGLLLCMVALVIYGSTKELGTPGEENLSLSFFDRKETLYFWYTDESLTDFINGAATAFGQDRNARVIPHLASQSEYLEAINEASLHGEQMPDLYMINHDSLGKAYLSGLAGEIMDPSENCNVTNFPQAALDAVTYQDKLVAYPYFYETSILVYNESYLVDWARQQAEREAAGEEDEEGTPPEEGGILNEEEVAARTLDYLAEAVPGTVDDILRIADTFDVPPEVEGIMKWDVSDIFFNYWFVGNYMIVGGDPGDDESNMNINNLETVQCLEVYQALNQFFYIESNNVTYESVVQDFIEGKLVFTIATLDMIETLEKAKADGSFAYEYGISMIPDVSNELKSRSMSVTTAVAVNGYSAQKELANEFADFLTNDYTQNLYDRTGKVSANLNANADNGPLQIAMMEYAGGVPLPKMIETSNFWIQVEILFSKVWNGENAGQLVEELSNQIMIQVGR